MRKVISYTDKDYFQYGKLFIRTRDAVNCNFVVYGAGLTKDQISVLADNNIEHKPIDENEFQSKMQFLKFSLMSDENDGSGDGISFVDFDTFFLNDWWHIFNQDIDLGVTVRNNFKDRVGQARAFSNGGVIHSKQTESGKKMCQYAIDTMQNGGDKNLPEYDDAFKQIESATSNRPKNKTWERENLRWWCDQMFLSAFVWRYYKKNGHKNISNNVIIDDLGYKIGLYNCDLYNRLDANPNDLKRVLLSDKKVYIMHLKNKGREIVNPIGKILDNRS